MVAHLSRSIATTVAALAALTGASPALADDEYPGAVAEEAERLEPLSPWGLDYAEGNCRLARMFGSEDDRHLILIDQAWPADTFGLTVAGSSFRRYSRGDRAYIGMQSDVPMLRFDLPPTGNLGELGPAVILSTVGVNPSTQGSPPRLRVGPFDGEISGPRRAALDPAEGAMIERIILERAGKAVSFETGSLEEAFGALNACTAELLRDWGLDPAKHKSFTPLKWQNQDEIVKNIQRRYPASALNRGEQAIFRMRVIVDETGAVTDCNIEAATDADALDSPACGEMQAAEFEPARDAEGNPMASFYATTISYQIGR